MHFVLNADSVTIDPRVELQKKARLRVVRLLLSEQLAKNRFFFFLYIIHFCYLKHLLFFSVCFLSLG